MFGVGSLKSISNCRSLIHLEFRQIYLSFPHGPHLCSPKQLSRELFVRGLPYMTSSEKREMRQICGQTLTIFADKEGGGGVKRSQNYVDVIYGSPLTSHRRIIAIESQICAHALFINFRVSRCSASLFFLKHHEKKQTENYHTLQYPTG